MLLAKLNKISPIVFWAVIVFTIIYFITRISGLRGDTINPDGVNWHFRSEQFVNGIKYFQWEKTYQHYHPGVTLMWISGVSIELYKQVTGIKSYSVAVFQNMDFIAKLSLVFAQYFISLTILFYLRRLVGFWKAYWCVILFSLEPFFIGNSRLYHLDVLLSLLLFLGVIATILAARYDKIYYHILTGAVFGLSFLTKSLGIGGILFYIWTLLFFRVKNSELQFSWKMLRPVLIGLVSFVFTIFVLFPALWVKPVYYLNFIFSESARVGIRKGHEQIVLGETTTDAGPMYYPIVLFMRLSPFMILGILLFFTSYNKLKFEKRDMFFIIAFYLAYLIAMTIPAKKIDRYMIVMYPFLSLLSVFGYEYLIKLKESYKVIIGLFLGLFILWPIIIFYPYYFTYFSPIFINANNANKVITFKPFGIGMYELKDKVVVRYTDQARLGFIDTKPMKAVYANSKVFDIRVNGTSDYDYLILGIGEEMPEKVLKSKVTFEKDYSLYINGLEYWRIYAKKR